MRDVIELIAFHDERKIRKPDWLYHGFVLCETNKLSELVNELEACKNSASCDSGKRIHFNELNSGAQGSSRTNCAIKWANSFRDRLYEIIRFYLFGVNLKNVNYNLYLPKGRDFKIYNTFFEIALFSACRYFFDANNEYVEVQEIVAEKRDVEKGNPFPFHAPYKINKREKNVFVKNNTIKFVSSIPERETTYRNLSHVLNFVDVLVGAFSEVFDYTSKSKQGCLETAERVCPICRRLSENQYNPNSRYYKKYAVSFFPKIGLSSSELTNLGALPPLNQFYYKRELRLNQLCFPSLEKLMS